MSKTAGTAERYYRSLNEIYRVAGFCLADKDFEKAFIYYMRFICGIKINAEDMFCSLALEELPNHRNFQGFSSAEKNKAESSLQNAVQNAEMLKKLLKTKFEQDATQAQLHVISLENIQPAAEGSRSDWQSLTDENEKAKIINANVSTDHIKFSLLGNYDKPGKELKTQDSSKNQSDIEKLGFKGVVIAGDLIEKFTKAAEGNTKKNVETCAIICGLPAKRGVCQITHAVIPKQIGASDSCNTFNEEEVFAYQDSNNLITMGWIHTHPSQTAFLSSIDLHTHCSYQLMMPEAIAIVVAPKYNEIGLFRLTDRGMVEIGECRVPGFHPHQDSSLFYYCCEVRFDTSVEAALVDFR
ncbi:unnamed protein product [Dracunculus medinensis]|uniref:MPN domain-containing protein n=1 Tax=Dracunculus medinensis TaxID=318479 RepID=A0A0N4U3S2_DRAME|nr:unnamed protein product [Dracunculus medinensis]